MKIKKIYFFFLFFFFLFIFSFFWGGSGRWGGQVLGVRVGVNREVKFL